MGKDWKYIEKLVRALEQSVSPNARVEHDVHLPQIGSPSGAKSQCDIVIWEGSAARPTITIVEVQSRKSKVKINDFLGWLKKRDLVGAHKLVCVSRQAFSSTIKEIAKKEGGRVVLIMLHELSPSSLPLDFIVFHMRYRYFKFRSLLNIRVGVSHSHLEELGIGDRFHKEKRPEIAVGDKVWSIDGVSVVSLEELMRERTEPYADFSGVSNFKIEFDSDPPFYTFFEGFFIKSTLDIDFDCVSCLYTVPMSVLGYEQVEHGVLGWVMTGDLKTEFGDIGVKIPIYRGESGDFRVSEADIIIDGEEGTGFKIYKAGTQPPWYG